MMTLPPTAACDAVIDAMASKTRPLLVLGAEGALRGLLLARAAQADASPVIYVASDEQTAINVARDAAFFLGAKSPSERDLDGSIVVIPDLDVSPYADVSPDTRVVGARLAACARLLEAEPPRIVVASLRSWMRRVMPRTGFERLSQTWLYEEERDRDEAAAQLVAAGYTRVDVVEDPGTFAVRGGVIDVFVPRLHFPVRIEWFGDEIERMRLFDPQSQRSLRDIESVLIHPVRETVVTTSSPLREQVFALADEVHAPSSRSRQVLQNLEQGLDFFGIEAMTPVFHDTMVALLDYLPKARWLVDDIDTLRRGADQVMDELDAEYGRARDSHAMVSSPTAFMLKPAEIAEHLMAQPVLLAHSDVTKTESRDVLRINAGVHPRLRVELEAARQQKGAELLRPVVDHIRRLTRSQDDGGPSEPWQIVLSAPNVTHAERMTSLLRGYGLHLAEPRPAEHEPLDLRPGERTRVEVIAGDLSTGFESADDRCLLLSEADIFGRITKKARKANKRMGVGSLSQLREGDFVVHVVHGVGRYVGLCKLNLRGIPGDFVLIEYAGKDRLYLPVYRLGEIERYVSADAKPPKLDKMGGVTFASKTAKVKAEVRQIAEELLQIYAQREAMEGHAYSTGGELYREFEATFPFEETPDQQDAIDAVQRDLSKPQPMDRLVCGDVGFGKTEVALRAAFRVASSGKQVAVLAPTTVLVQQHFYTFRERMDRFGVRVAKLNRLTDAKSKREIVAGIKAGEIDVVVGTHRLLSRDVRFKDLGLVIIDEEQRFGVSQKERFKKLKTQIDVLTLTATPIPRTLHMSLLGIREISLITTPPVDRLAVRTFLTRQSEQAIEEGIRKEMARGGQVFYVVPKIQGIEEHARRVRQMVPEARIAVAHGKVPAELLEKTMLDFVEHRADVLVSTTIIESGLDIPRANTMFIARADMFGLSQLYQLRGRVGRSKHRAFCYLMVNSLERLAPEAKRRLEAVVRYAELGSGFHIASQDLEIRGAGDILGARQSGQIQAIGFDAYSRILSEAVAELRGQEIVHENDPEMVFDIPAFLPDSFIEDTGTRLDLYRRLSAARDIDEVESVMDEIRDRFGELPEEATVLGFVMGAKTYGRQLQATAVELRGTKLTVRLSDTTPIPAATAMNLQKETQGFMRLASSDRIVVQLPEGDSRRIQLSAALSALQSLAWTV